jgi:hypothetical protein
MTEYAGERKFTKISALQQPVGSIEVALTARVTRNVQRF